MIVPEEIKKCIAFICEDSKDGPIPRATGFFVSVPSEKFPEKYNWLYFITARHASAKLNGNLLLRLNGLDNKAKYIKISDVAWHFHPNHSNDPVDVAVISISPIPDIDMKWFPVEGIMTPELFEKEGVGIGSEVFITGLFSKVSGENKNSPIVRIGNLAMYPEEKIKTKDFGDMKAYLIEARSIGGVSGSPVFFCADPFAHIPKGSILYATGNSRPRFFLGGLIHGHWDISDEQVDFDTSVDKNINIGVASVVPGYKIKETLFSDELIQDRKKKDETLKD